MNEVQPLSSTLDDGSSSLCICNTKVFTFPIANLGCPNPTFTGSPRIGQFASVRIDSITDNKSNIYQSCPTDGAHKLEDWGAPATVKKRGMEVTLLCDGNGGLSEVSNSQLTLRLVQ